MNTGGSKIKDFGKVHITTNNKRFLPVFTFKHGFLFQAKAILASRKYLKRKALSLLRTCHIKQSGVETMAHSHVNTYTIALTLINSM